MNLNNNNVFSQFIMEHQNHPHIYLTPTTESQQTAASASQTLPEYQVSSTPQEFISEYTYHRFEELRHLTSVDSSHAKDLKQTVRLIYTDYHAEYQKQSLLTKIIHKVLSILGLHHTSQQIDQVYQKVLQKIETLEQPLKLGSLKLSESAIKNRVAKHRAPAMTPQEYKAIALSAGPYTKAVETKKAAQKAEFEGLSPEQSAIKMATLKEEACRETYQQHMQTCIDQGAYDPEIIPYDIDALLKPAPSVDHEIVSMPQVKSMLREEVQRYHTDDKLTSEQAHRLTHDALHVATLYRKAFPEKSYRDTFFLVRDLIRIATYQEYYDKGSFNGSDHGSKHIHNNILGALSLHHGMKRGSDYTIKDQLIEELTHFYHDIGYSVGLAATDFNCCKDHPFIGAKMIEANRDYFLHYLDEESYQALHDCVLCHAIIRPDLTARTESNGVHRNMIRAVTSISDACAVTYDRKTQEFWEQPQALVALARIKSFLILFPQYEKKLGDDIVKGPWEGYNENNPLDKMAYDVFLHTRQELEDMVENYEIPKAKKDLFRQAINQQFNAFKANITLGQYGAVLDGIEAVPNTNRTSDADPAYTPQVTLGVSIAYGVLKDLFGEDQANDSFKKLVGEFSGNMKDITQHLQEISTGLSAGKRQQSRVIATGVARFKLLGRFVMTPRSSDLYRLDSNLKTALSQIHEVFQGHTTTLSERSQALTALNLWMKQYRENATPPLTTFIQTLLPALSTSGTHASHTQDIVLLTRLSEKPKLDDQDLEKIHKIVPLLLMSDKEYLFMRGQNASVTRTQILTSLNPTQGDSA